MASEVCPRLLLTAREAAQALAISQRTLWELTQRGELPALRLPGRGIAARALRYDLRDLLAWIDRTKKAQAEATPVQANGRGA